MKVSELIKKISLNKVEIKYDFEVEGLAYDSRNVKENYIFFAIKGFKEDGNKFVKNAIANGAKLIITSEKINEVDKVNYCYIENVRRTMAEMSCAFYDFPSEKLNLIGITGTNGKTTTSYLIKSIIEENNFKSGLIGTINYISSDSKKESSLTTPESIELNQMLRDMVNSGYEYCIMEVSSVALVLDRVYGLKFKTAVFTNLTPEHLDFHTSMDEYFKAKKILFDELPQTSFAVSNSDDEYGNKIVNNSKAKKYFYSINEKSEFQATNLKINTHGLSFNTSLSGNEYKFETGITGRFNIYNSLAAIETGVSLGFEISSIKSALSKFNYVDGRFNIIHLKNGADAIIDYSHTSDSLKNAIEAAIDLINERGEKGRVITIFGCGGNKDKTKRPVMGNFATQLSDYVIITSDNPRFEDPMEIINEILTGIDDKSNFEIEVNRELAIKRGLEISEKGDLILICGKGHETYQEIKGVKNHFDDKEIVNKYDN